ncbi:MAG: DpnII family type II restriction endonuclease [Aquificaceae bacterium]
MNEICLLNSLTKVEGSKRENHMKELIINYPKVLEVLPLLIAERVHEGKIKIFDDEIFEVIEFEFMVKDKYKEEEVENIVKFCRETGIMDLFEEIKDLYDYLFGVEVGLDSNARKNRSGEIFEKTCVEKIKKIVRDRFKIVEQAPTLSKGRRHDLVIYARKPQKPLLVVECNFYNTEGSKLQTIAREYIKLKEELSKKHIGFLWITDGPAWKKMRRDIEESMEKLDWILNLRMLGLMDRILKVILFDYIQENS